MSGGHIYWDAPLNCMAGCTKASPGCKYCWAESMHEARRKGLLNPANKFTNEMYRKSFNKIQLFDYDNIRIPNGAAKTLFVNNTSDTFHEKAPTGHASVILQRAYFRQQHRYLFLTKRPHLMAGRLKDYCNPIMITDNCWFGTTCEDQKRADERIPHLLKTPATNRWLSLEPLLGPINLFENKGWLGWEMVDGVSWVVVGAESGPNRRPCKIEWVRSIVDQCQNANVPVFVKQLNIDGRCVHDIEKFPADLQIRQLPWENAA